MLNSVRGEVIFGPQIGDLEEGGKVITGREGDIFSAGIHDLCVYILICYCCTLQHNLCTIIRSLTNESGAHCQAR